MIKRHGPFGIVLTFALCALAALPAEAGTFEDAVRARWRGAWLVTEIETFSTCDGRYYNNDVSGRYVAARAGRPFEPGELANRLDALHAEAAAAIDTSCPMGIADLVGVSSTTLVERVAARYRPVASARGIELNHAVPSEAVATSGDYMQPYAADCSQHHIVDPRRGRSAPELASSTVAAPTAALADGLATLTMVLGPHASVELIENQKGCEGHFVAKDRAVFRTSGFAKV